MNISVPEKNNPFPCSLLTVEQMGIADKLTIQSGISPDDLMETAGNAVATEIQKRWTPRPCIVLCGPGNNGGDGYVIARVLHEAGWSVRVISLCTTDKLKGEAANHAAKWRGTFEVLDENYSIETIDDSELIVDALFGAGLNRALDGPAKRLLQFANRCHIPCVAVDIPSGVHGDTGQTEFAPSCELTVTFFRKKPGHLLQPGSALCGEIKVADIGISERVLDQIRPTIFQNTPYLWQSSIPTLSSSSHKYTRGHALVIGGAQMTGASRLSALSAARIGAGLVSIAAPLESYPIYASSLLSIMVKPFETDEELFSILDDKRFTAFLIGPGAGRSISTRVRVQRLLETGLPTVLDADAISVFADDAAALANSIHGPCVMTPHEGEFQRIYAGTGCKLERAREAARRFNSVIVLKGSDTVIAAPDGLAIINADAPPTLATAGSGDVLSGIIAGLLAQRMPALEAAAYGVWIHSQAAKLFGPGLIADDLPSLIPQVLRENQ